MKPLQLLDMALCFGVVIIVLGKITNMIRLSVFNIICIIVVLVAIGGIL